MSERTPKDRLFSEEHEWVKVDDDEALMGISDHAQSSLGDVVYVELPDVGKEIKQGSSIGVVESVKAVSDIYAPVSGVVKAVNKAVLDNPELLNRDPYGEGWLLVITPSNVQELDSLLAPADYEHLLAEEAK